MDFSIEMEREDDGRWIAEVPELPGVMVYGATQAEAKSKVQSLALSVFGCVKSVDLGHATSQN
ncbi:hypothetical protein SAMN05421819_3756 [Bryocella elongata]|uniref:HicB_like antitoxin of toxin-antitoxin system n=1 Tax=Bryocella elongata TaxID=863522 RepID=A0A1H6BJE6_9BACT|nr:type II toxin-antitoxin system HicB family antitoxin [Bryocella elongata]SEG60830.1 hypothetical protein SAMN05421819_3756 [Bryocella elongata]